MIFFFGIIALILAGSIWTLQFKERSTLEFIKRILEVLAQTVRMGQPLGPIVTKMARETKKHQAWVLTEMGRLLSEGCLLSEALDRVKKPNNDLNWEGDLFSATLFPAHLVATVRAAEGTPKLESALETMIDQATAALSARLRTLAICFYPAMLCLILQIIQATGSFTPVLAALGRQPYYPGWDTGISIALYITIALILVLAIFHWSPGFRFLAQERLLRTTALLVKAGLPIQLALRRASAAAGNKHIAHKAILAADSITEGADPVRALKAMVCGRSMRRRAAVVFSGDPGKLTNALEFLAAHSRERSQQKDISWRLVPQQLLLIMVAIKIFIIFSERILAVQQWTVGYSLPPW